MWDITRRIKGLPEDACRQRTNRMLQREWEGESISYKEWRDFQDLMLEELDEQDDPAVSEDLEANRHEIVTLLQKFGLSFGNYFRLSQSLCELAEASPLSDELLRVYCYILCDSGHILETGFQDSEDLHGWTTVMDDAETLFGYLQERRKKAQHFQSILEQMKKIRVVSNNLPAENINTSQQEAVFEVYTQIFVEDRAPELRNNLMDLLQTISQDASLTVIKPLVLYQMLVCHGKRLRMDENPGIEYKKLWKYKSYIIEEDNGKNFKQNVRYLELFEELCEICRTDPQVDLPLCVYGFGQLSNLGEFYLSYPEEDQKLRFDIPIEEIVSESFFTCFEDGYIENTILEKAKLSEIQLDKFLSSGGRTVEFREISDVMNANLERFLLCFLDSDTQGKERVCEEILGCVPPHYKTVREKTLFLAAIYDALTQAADEASKDYLMQTGYTFCLEKEY